MFALLINPPCILTEINTIFHILSPGVHTLGRCNAGVSGYRGPWDESQDKLDNKYFQNMVEPGWFVEQRDELPIVQ